MLVKGAPGASPDSQWWPPVETGDQKSIASLLVLDAWALNGFANLEVNTGTVSCLAYNAKGFVPGLQIICITIIQIFIFI